MTEELAHAAIPALGETEATLRFLADTIAAAIFVFQGTGFRYVNPAVEQITGYSRNELLGMRFWEVIHPEFREIVRSRGLARQRGEDVPVAYEVKILCKNGDERWVSYNAGALEFEGRPAVIGTAFDITSLKQAERALRESEAQFRTLAESMAAATFIIQGTTLRYVNPAAEVITGYRRDELIGSDFTTLVHPDYRAQARGRAMTRQRGEPAPTRDEVRIVRKDGEVRWVDFTAVTMPYEGAPALLGTAFDITDRKSATKALRRSEAWFRALVENSSDIVLLMDAEGKVHYVGPSVQQVLGFRPDEMLGPQAFALIHPDDYSTVWREYQLVAAKPGRKGHARYRIRHKDGSWRWFDSLARNLLDEPGVAAIFINSRDVTDQQEVETAYRTLVDHSLQGIVLLQDTQLVFSNSANAALYGHTVEEQLALTPSDLRALIHPDDREAVSRLTQEVMENLVDPHPFEFRIVGRSGEIRWIECYASRVEYRSRSALQVVTMDITERKQKEAERREAENLSALTAAVGLALAGRGSLREILSRCTEVIVRHLDVALARIWTLDSAENVLDLQASAGLISYIDKRYERVPVGTLNIGVVAATGQPRLRTPLSPDPWIAEPQWAEREGIVAFAGYPLVVEERVVGVLALWAREDLSTRRLDTIAYVANAIGVGVERKRVEDELRRSEERFALAVAGANDGLWDFDLRHNRAYFSPRWKEMLGHLDHEIAPHPDEWRTRVHPDDREQAARDLLEHLSGRTPLYRSEHRLLHRDGTYRWVLARGMTVRDGDDRPHRMAGSLTDITERKLAEEATRQHHAELAHVLRQTTMGEMAAVFAHEVNQPLSAIVSYAQGCERRMRAGTGRRDEILGAMGEISGQAVRAGEIIRRVRDFVRKGDSRREAVDVNQVAQEALQFVSTEARQCGITLSIELDRSLPSVEADRIQIEQVILNLLRNGMEAMPERKTESPRLSLRTALVDGGVEVAVSDTGNGLAPEIVAKVFEPFITSKPGGLGMGLSICRSIVEAHGGRLWFQPNHGRGTTFRFRLPA